MIDDRIIIAQKVLAKPTAARFMGSLSVPANIVCAIALAKPRKLVITDGIAIFRKVFANRLVGGSGDSGSKIASLSSIMRDYFDPSEA